MTRKYTRARRIVLGLLVLVSLGLVMFRLYSVAPASVLRVDVASTLEGPSLKHPLGTDFLGRDLFLRSLVGMSNSLIITGLALVIAVVFGCVIGSAVEFSERVFVKTVSKLVVDLLLAIPAIILLIAMMAILGGGLIQAFLVIGVIGSGPMSRVLAAETRRVASRDYVVSEKLLGFSNFLVWIQTILPESLIGATPYIILYAVELIGIEAGLSFLGLSIQPPRPSLGSMIFEGLNNLTSSAWLLLAPALFLVPCLLGLNLFAQNFLKSQTQEGRQDGGRS